MTVVYTSAASPATDQTFYFKLGHPQKGTPQTGVSITSLNAIYIRDRMALVSNSLTSLPSTTGTHADNQGIEIDSSLAPGIYRVDFPDAAFATGSSRVIIGVVGSNIDPAYIEVSLQEPIEETIVDDVIEGSYTLRQLLRIISSTLFGKASGGGTTTITFRDLGDTKDRITATVDANGDRSAVSLDGT